MQTITLKIDDDIFDKFLNFLDLMPSNKIKVFKELEFVSDEEQKEIEELLKDPECQELSGYFTTIEI